ncbi:MAG: CPBP family intramembrane metalloprotease [Lachnospiraceae bacterium]|nr:CPBP family intramembrane metalloprotease [Lachnospiraceae bacterium]
MERVKKVNRVFLFVVLATVAASFLVILLQMFTDSTVVLLFANQVILVLPALIFAFTRPEGFAETIGLRKLPWITVPLLVLEMLLLFPVVSVLNVLSMFLVENHISDTITDIVGEGSVVIAVAVIALVPAIFEEIIFRGVIYNYGYRKISPIKGMLLCGLLFGLLHMNLNQFCYAFVLGAALCLVLEATDSIVATMIMHFTLNATSTIIAFVSETMMDNEAVQAILGELEGEEEIITNETLMQSLLSLLPIAIVCGVLAWVLLRVIAQKCGREEHLRNLFQKPETTTWEAVEYSVEGTNLFTPALIVGIVICIVMMGLTELSYGMAMG